MTGSSDDEILRETQLVDEIGREGADPFLSGVHASQNIQESKAKESSHAPNISRQFTIIL